MEYTVIYASLGVIVGLLGLIAFFLLRISEGIDTLIQLNRRLIRQQQDDY